MRKGAILWSMFCLGAFSLIAQVTSMREMLVAFFGNELTIGTTLACWLVCVCLGALAARLVVNRIDAARMRLVSGSLLVGVAVVLPIQVYVLRTIRGLIAAPIGEYVPFGAILGVAFLVFLPCCFMIGFFFPIACRLLAGTGEVSDDSAVSLVYGFEAAGSMTGGIILTFVLLPHFTPCRVVLFCCGVVLTGAAAVYTSRTGRLFSAGLALAVLLAAVAYPPWLESVEQWTVLARWRAFGVVSKQDDPRQQGAAGAVNWVGSTDTIYQNLALTESDGQYALYGNGQVSFVFPDPIEDEHSVHFIMAQRPGAGRLLLLGGNPIGHIPELLKYPLERLTYVELDAGVGRMIRSVLPSEYGRAVHDSRVRVQIGDAVKFLRECRERFDVVIVNAPEPVTAGLNRFYALEFYREIERVLEKDGFMAMAAPASLRMRSEAADISASIYRTMKLVFPTVIATAETTNVILASNKAGGVTFDRQTLFDRSRSAALSNRFFRPEYFLAADRIDPEKLEFVRTRFEASDVPVNTMLRPVTYFCNLMLWSRFSGSSIEGVLDRVRRATAGGIVPAVLGFGIFCLAVALILVGMQKRHHRARDGEGWARFMVAVVLAGTGFCAMALEVVLILMFQSLYGYVYTRMGLIVAMFMLGLVAGAASGRAMAHGRGRIPLLWLAGMEMFLLVCALAVPRLGIGFSTWRFGEAAIHVCVVVVGWAVGVEFPLANRVFRHAGGNLGSAAAITDASDHLGAAFGALIVGVVLVPVLGIAASCSVLAAFKGAGLLCLAAAAATVRQKHN